MKAWCLAAGRAGRRRHPKPGGSRFSAEDTLIPQVRAFSQLEPYEQHEPGIARFHWVLKQDEIPGLCSGHVELEGPIHKTPAAHDDFDQTYLVYAGSGTVHLDDRSYRITEPSAVLIPHGTKHSVELQSGETIKYVYVNRLLH